MDDVRLVLYPIFGRPIRRNYLYVALKELIDLGVLECVNPKEKSGKIFRLTEKGERVLE